LDIKSWKCPVRLWATGTLWKFK